jgi:hypothetical protein
MFSNKYAEIETKSHYNSSQNYNGFYSFYDHYTGETVGGVHKLSFAEQIRKNVPIQTIISNQLGIINDAELQILKRDKDKTDLPTTYKPALDFLNILQNPNFNPSPQNWNAIVRGLYKPYLSNGIVALVLKGAKSKTIDRIEIASCVTYNNSNNVITYNIQTTGKGYSYRRIFGEEELVSDRVFYTNGDDIAIIFGNFDDYLKCYVTVLQPLMDVILWNNNIITASNSFYENSCRPSSIITVKFLDGEGNIMNNSADNESMMKIIADIKTQLKGSANTGKVIVPSQPNLDITVTPISITQNANDIKEQLALTAQMIYSAFAGYNKDIIEGKSEYAGNKEMSLKEQYDSTVATFTNIILDKLNAFLQQWFQYVGKEGDILDRRGVYLNFDITGIQRYKDAKVAEAIELAKSQIIDREEARTKIRQYKDDYADLRILSDAENGFIGEKKSNTL